MATRIFFFLSLLATFLVIPMLLAAQESCSITVATLNGTAKTGKGSLGTGSSLTQGDTIFVGSGSLLELKIGEGAAVKIGANSKVYVDASYCPGASAKTVRLKLSAGSLWAKGSPDVERLQITSEHFLVMVGTSTITAKARYLDTSFTLSRGRQRIETRDWSDTVEVESYTFPFVGQTSSIYSLAGEPLLIPWGGRAATLTAGMQATFGFKPSHIPSDPKKIEPGESLFTKEGNYVKGS